MDHFSELISEGVRPMDRIESQTEIAQRSETWREVTFNFLEGAAILAALLFAYQKTSSYFALALYSAGFICLNFYILSQLQLGVLYLLRERFAVANWRRSERFIHWSAFAIISLSTQFALDSVVTQMTEQFG